MIPIYKPYLPSGSLNHAYEALNSTWISSQGKYLEMVRERLQELLNVKYVLMLNNGTSAMHLAAKCVARAGKKEIIVPNNVYVAALNAFLFDKDFKLFSVETDLGTWNYNLDKLDKAIKNHPEAAVLVVHNIGNIINIPALKRRYPETLFVEDACEAFTGIYEKQQAGTASFISAFSTFANKTCTSGEGGFITTNNEEAYLFAKCIQGQGQSEKRFVHNELGTNYRMTNIAAAILWGQLEALSEIIEKKSEVFRRYREALVGREDIILQTEEEETINANWMFGVRIKSQQSFEAADIYFRERDIEIRPMFFPITAHQHLVINKAITIGECETAEQLNRECVILPSFPGLTQTEQIAILNTLNNYVKELNV